MVNFFKPILLNYSYIQLPNYPIREGSKKNVKVWSLTKVGGHYVLYLPDFIYNVFCTRSHSLIFLMDSTVKLYKYSGSIEIFAAQHSTP